MNINDHVWVRLTEAGVKLWKEKWPNQFVYEDGRWFDIQLWSLMNLLGDRLRMWDHTPYIVNQEIATEKPKELGGFTPPKAPVVNPALPPDGRLTRTEIFLRLVEAYCRQPGGFTHDAKYSRCDTMAHLQCEAEKAYETWGGR